MRKILAGLLVLALILGCCPAFTLEVAANNATQPNPGDIEVPLGEDARMTVTPSKTEACPGEVIDFVISVSKVSDCKSGAVSVEYDNTVLEYVEGSGACTLSNAMMGNFGMNGGILSGSFLYMSGTTVSGEIFRFQMKVKDAAALGSTSVSFTGSVRNSSGESANTTIDPVTLNVVCSHSWSVWSCVNTTEHQRICTACLETETAEHQWDEGQITTPATCVAEGVMTYACSGCTASYTEQIRDDAHMVGSDPVLYYYDCEHCDTMGTETYEAAPGDLDGNDTVNEDDAIYLLQHVLMPDMFPL